MFTEEDGPLQATQTGAPEAIEEEMDKYTRMMNDCAGVTDGEIIFWLHRANEKNKSLHASFLKRYPKETSFSEIFEEARDAYGAGDFVLVAKKDEVMFRKMSFSCEKPKEGEKPAPEVKVDPLEKLSVAMERLAVVDKVSRIINDSREKPATPGVDPTIQVMLTMLQGMQAQNTALLQGILSQRREAAPGGNESLLEAIKLGSALAGGKIPLEEGEGGLVELLKPLIPHIPAVIAMLTGKGPQPQPPIVRGPVQPRPLPPHAAGSSAAGVPLPGPVPPVAVAVTEDPQALVMRRIVDEVKFVLTLPATPKLREHVINYIDSYNPDILRQADVVPADMFAAYVVSLDPAFAGQEAFFIDLHKQYMAGMDETPEPDPESGARDRIPGGPESSN
jgi:hypothetical protein